MIAMADKGFKSIFAVRAEDTVLSGGGREVPVAGLISCLYDSDIIMIGYRGSWLVQATPGQPFLTDRGTVKACDIVVGDRLKTPDYDEVGKPIFWDVESTRRVPYIGHVYGLVIACDDSHVADCVSVLHGHKI